MSSGLAQKPGKTDQAIAQGSSVRRAALRPTGALVRTWPECPMANILWEAKAQVNFFAAKFRSEGLRFLQALDAGAAHYSCLPHLYPVTGAQVQSCEINTTFHGTPCRTQREAQVFFSGSRNGSRELKHKVVSECTPDWACEKEARAEVRMRAVLVA